MTVSSGSGNKTIDKKMEEAEDITQLKHLLDLELKRMAEKGEIDIILFMGVDGRTFATNIPPDLTPPQYRLFNLVKANIPHICGQLQTENLDISIQKFSEGVLVISGVGDNAFLVSIIVRDIDITNIQDLVAIILRGSTVIRHIFELRPLSDSALKKYPSDVSQELKKLSRLLFKQRFDQTAEYKKNMKILDFIKEKVQGVVGIGATDEIITVTFNEIGTTAPYMKDKQWISFTEKIIQNHIRNVSGDIVADDCLKTWLPEIESKIKSFV